MPDIIPGASTPIGKIIIVGRPNVGKSSLFNRIISSRRAMVSDYPGTTIDYIEAETTLNGLKFTIVDTGGWTPPANTCADDNFSNKAEGVGGIRPCVRNLMRQFVEKLLSDCPRKQSVVIFVVDVKDGLNPLDVEFANYIRRKNLTANTILAANKSDTDKREYFAAEFYKLGFGEPFPVSAQNGRNVNEILEAAAQKILKNISQKCTAPKGNDNEITSAIPKVMILGRPNAGKSTLFNRLAGFERSIVDKNPGTTRESINTIATIDGEKKFELIDTPGIARTRKFKNYGEGKERAPLSFLSFVSVKNYMPKADVAVLLIDALEGVTKADESLAGMIAEQGLGAIVAFNKWDAVADGKREELFKKLSSDFKTRFNFLAYARFLVISALTGSGIKNNLVPAILSTYERYCIKPEPKKISATLKDALLSKPLITPSGKRLVFTKLISTSAKPPALKIAVNEPSMLHFSYRRYLSNIIATKHPEFTQGCGVPLILNFVKDGGIR